MFTERKQKRSNQWVSADNFTLDKESPDAYECESNKDLHRIGVCSGRNYTLFGILAGIRRYNNDHHLPIRGIPADASDLVKAEYKKWGADAHTATWATITELEQHFWETDSHQLYLMLQELESHLKSSWDFEPYDDEYKNRCRVIFWFDN